MVKSPAQLRLIPGAKNKPRPAPEKDLVRAIIDGLKKMGILCWSGRIHVRGHLPPYLPVLGKGTPDILGIFPGGQMFGIEGKRPGEKPSTEQLWWHASFRAQGGRIYVATDVDEALFWAQAARRIQK
jgi:hypothetical protein